MVDRAPIPGRGSSRCCATGFLTRILVLLVLLPAPALTGCIAQPSVELTVRPGDLIRAEIVLAGETVTLPADSSAANVTGLCERDVLASPAERCPQAERAYVAASKRPADLPSGWRGVAPLPQPVVEAIQGLAAGEHLVARGIEAFGPHDDELVEHHPRHETVPRFVDDAKAYGRTWNVTELPNGTLRIDPASDEEGASVEDPRWCGPRFCLFDSVLTSWTSEHLLLEHQAREGQQVRVEGLNATLTVTGVNRTTILVDGNDPRAGQRFDLYAHVTRIRAPPEGVQRAPGFELTAVNGTRLELDRMLGKPVVLEFFTTWCPTCVKNTGHLRALDDTFGDRIALVAIDVDPSETPSQLRRFIQDHGVTWPIAVDQDGSVSRAYSVGSLSTEVIISPEGAIVHVETGVADHERVSAIVQSLLPHDHGHHHAGPDHAHDTSPAATGGG